VAAHGVRLDAATLPGLVAEVDGKPTGLLTYHVDCDEWEVVTINALEAGARRRGFELVAFHRVAVTRSRAALKPSIPLEVEGIAVRHELELERVLR
jgi:hypothetical protein